LGVVGVAFGVLLAVAIVVDVEAAVQAEAGVEDEGADERAGAITGGLENRREGRQPRPETEETVRADAVTRRRDAGQYRPMSGQCWRLVAYRVTESESHGGEAIDRRCQIR